MCVVLRTLHCAEQRRSIWPMKKKTLLASGSQQSCNCKHRAYKMADPAFTVAQIGSLHQLLPEILNKVLPFLDHAGLVHLHIATAVSFPIFRQRVSATKCARHWLNLSKRLPPHLTVSIVDSVDWEAAQPATGSSQDGSYSGDEALPDDLTGQRDPSTIPAYHEDAPRLQLQLGSSAASEGKCRYCPQDWFIYLLVYCL